MADQTIQIQNGSDNAYPVIKTEEKQKILYSDSFKDTSDITLSETAANFSEMIIQFQNNDGMVSSVHVYDPNGKMVPLTLTNIGADHSTVYIKSKLYSISGTRLIRAVNSSGVFIHDGQAWFNNANAQGCAGGGSYIGITKVVGIR